MSSNCQTQLQLIQDGHIVFTNQIHIYPNSQKCDNLKGENLKVAKKVVKLKDVKQEIRDQEWAEQIQECQKSRMTVKEWCWRNNISPNTYYTILRKIREELLTRQPEL